MNKPWVVAYVLVMVGTVVGVDVVFLRGHLWVRLIVNIALVVIFGAVYWRFLRHP